MLKKNKLFRYLALGAILSTSVMASTSSYAAELTPSTSSNISTTSTSNLEPSTVAAPKTWVSPSDKLGQKNSVTSKSVTPNTTSTSTYYSFGATSFSNYVWIDGGYVFPYIDNIDVEISGTADIAFKYYDRNGNYVWQQAVSGSQWKSVYPNGGAYKVTMNNNGASGTTVNLMHGEVDYEY